jgi:hypothetical protein
MNKSNNIANDPTRIVTIGMKEITVTRSLTSGHFCRSVVIRYDPSGSHYESQGIIFLSLIE